MPRLGRRDQIVESAVTLFSERGYHATTIRDIAEASGMQSGSLYAHISTKEDLLFEIIDRGAERFLAALAPVAAGPGTAAEKLRWGLTAHISVVAEHIAAARIFLHEWRAINAERRDIIQHKRDRYEALWARLIRQGVESGEFRPVDERFARMLVLSAANWLYQWYEPAGPLSPEETAARFTDLILGGLLAPKSEVACP